jgi:putative membrane-bound dehydrogenase-like protein
VTKYLAFGFLLLGAVSAFGQAPLDLRFQQSPAKPAPAWLKMVDYGQFDPRLKGYFVPEGIKVEIVADAPDIINPVGMTFDTDGTLYVLEWVEPPAGKSEKAELDVVYKDGSKRKVLIMRKPTKDRVKTLGFNAGKNVYDSAKVVLEEELPSSILLHDGWLYLSGQGTVRRYRQTQPGGAWDKKEIIARGFCGYHHHQVSGLTIGPDGWLYITSGDNDNDVEGSDGSRATVLRTGAIFRCRPDGSKMQVHSLGYRNPYRDVVFDAAGNMFHADNDNEDGSKFTGCRLMHIPDGADFGWRLRPGAVCCQPDHLRGAVYGELPGTLPPMLKTGRGSPAGLLLYNDAFFPEEYRGLLYYPDVFRKVIRVYRVAPQGATFEVTNEFELMSSHDPLFRPCQMVLGPDGAMYVCDWRTDSGGAGRLWGDGKHGRIYRLSWQGTAGKPAIALRGLDSWAKINSQADDDLLKTLASENVSDRRRAAQELARRGEKMRKPLLEIVAGDQPLRAQIAALGALQSLWDDQVEKCFIAGLGASAPEMRKLAADGLALQCQPGDGDAHDALARHINDIDPAVRRAVYMALGRIHAAGAADIIVNGLQLDQRKDEYLTDGLVHALEQTGKEGIAQLLVLADSGSDKDLNLVVDIFPRLRVQAAAEQIPVLLQNYHVTPEQKVALIRSYFSYPPEPPVPVEPLVKFLDKLPAAPTKKITQVQLNAMKLAALDVLAVHGKVDSDRLKTTLLGMLSTEEPATRRAVLETIVAARLTSAVPVLLEQLAAAREVSVKLELVRTLGQLNVKTAFNPLKKLLKSKDTSLRLEALRALAGIDNRATHKLAADLLGDADVQVQREVVVLLGQQPAGALLVGHRFAENKLPRSLLADVAEGLRRFADKEHPDIAELLSRVLKGGLLVSLEPKELARVSALVRTQGDPLRGRKLYLNNNAVACISCHQLEGVGGNVGPDLTRVWDTLSLEKVMESMLDPSKEIKEGYQTHVATTKKGLIISGLKVAQNDRELILKDTTGKLVHIATADLDEVVASPKSLMPDDVVRHLSFNEFLDLVAFLRDRKAQEELRGMVLTAWALGPVDADLMKSLPLEKNPDPEQTFDTPDKVRLRWTPIVADMSDKGFDLRPVIGKEPGSAYVLTHVFAPKEQKVQLHCQSGEKVIVWLNGKRLEEQPETTPLELKVGWNVLLLRLNNEAGDPRLLCRITGGAGVRISPRKE